MVVDPGVAEAVVDPGDADADFDANDHRRDFDQTTVSTMAAASEAMTARPAPMNSGDMFPDSAATRVKGTVNEKASTPRNPHHSPWLGCPVTCREALRLCSGDNSNGVALLSFFMNHDSSSRIVDALIALIDESKPGQRLPSSRDLVARFEASPVTVQKALATLARRGLVESRPGVGTFVRAQRSIRPPDLSWQTGTLGPRTRTNTSATAASARTGPDDFVLNNGYPAPELLPGELVKGALGRVARSAHSLRRSDPAGEPDLREWFAAELSAGSARGVSGPTAAEVTIVPGSQSSLGAILRSIVGVGRPLIVESPTYWGLILAAAQVGVRLVPIPTGQAGPDPEVLAEAFERTGATAFYAQPNFGTPLGGQWSPGLKSTILDIVRDRRAFLIEDDWAHDFGIDTQSQPMAENDADGHIVYIRSLTKSVSPAVRVAAVIAKGPARDRIRADVATEAMYVSSILQSVALDVVTRPAWRTHVRGLGLELGRRRDSLIAAIRAEAPQIAIDEVPRGGLNLWVRLPAGSDVDDFVARAAQEGVLVTGGDEWFPAESPAPYLRLNFAGPNPSGYAEAMRRLGDLMG